MIVLDLAQGSPEWRAARAGVVTASGFDKILTAGLKPSAQSHAYLCRLVAESVLGVVDATDDNAYTERGREMEPEARSWYAFDRDAEVKQVGFVLRDDRRVGCSPDGLVGEDGGVEIKCPLASTHVGYILEPDALVEKYRHQVQLSLLVTGRAWWDLVSYSPAIAPVVVRCYPDAAWRKAAEPALADFLARMDAALEKVRAVGGAPASCNPFL